MNLLLWFGAFYPALAVAQAEQPFVCPSMELGPAMPPSPDRSQAPLVIEAQSLDAGRLRAGKLRGNVELTRGDQYIATELLMFDPAEQFITVPGKISYRDQQVWLQGSGASYDLGKESGYFSLVEFGLSGSSAHGSARRAELEGGHTSRLFDLNYTSCPDQDPDWQMEMKELELRHDEGMGEAKGVKLEFKGFPLLYVPWFTFPIDDRRKSGFLYPNLGYSSDTGVEIGAPWYWNIAPNHDATLEPRWFSERGFMLTGEYRFLTHRTHGELEFDYMPDDRETDDERYHYQFRHYGTPWQRWRTELVLDRVSDERYFQDYGTSLRQTARQFVRSSALLSGVGRYWDFEFMADNFQVIDESIQPQNEPYRRVPRIAFWFDRPLAGTGLAFGLDSELVAFDRGVGVTGARLDLFPNLSWDRYNRWGFVKPRIGYRYTAYELDYQGLPGDESPSRGAAVASLDTGLVFDRFTNDGGYQTLEPRLFYLYVPYEEQDDLPVFDSGQFTFGFSQLFNPNRFAGGDRLGDANQLSLAVSTRKFDSLDGRERWSLSVGQIFYFDDRRVQLDEEAVEDADLSPFLAELSWRVSPKLRAVAGLQWDWDRSEMDVGTLGLRYTGETGQRITFEYRYRAQRVDQFDFRILWPLGERWRMLSRINYSFADDELLEIQGGFEYESCCWAFRTVLRRYLKNRDGEFRDGIYLELNLKGLASIGSGSRNLFP
ncbi:MAG: LPS assembly protein LptD [Gammaproteobacteria bacterium]|nr:LPS assembly protein LptD [Gammaproteobacteria bacterium]